MDYANMTREQFEEEICDFGDLKEWCWEHDCSICENIYDEDSMDDWVNECLVDWARDHTWRELYRILEELPTGESWYYMNDWGDWEYCECNFNEWKDEVLAWADENGEFNEKSFEDDEYVDPYILEPTEAEDVALEDMFSSDEVQVMAVKEEENESEEEQEEFYDIFVPEGSEDLDWLV